MIDALKIDGLKRFDSRRLRFAPLTVLAGLNGTGKTSVVHALLLAREASQGVATSVVRLNGPFELELGSAEDVRNWSSDGDIRIGVEAAGSEANWRFAVSSEEALFLEKAQVPAAPPTAFGAAARAFTYLSAERLGPRSVLGASPLPAEALEVGVRGEFSAQVLAAIGDRPLQEAARLHPLSSERTANLLKYQVEKWLSEIARPVEVEASRLAGTAVTTLRFRAPGGEWVRAPNMGFGVTYALPIVLGGLVAAPDGLFVVENPEAHLHPAGQSRMGVFLAWLAAHGVQVVVETHSDHLLNGIRRAIGELRYLNVNDGVVHSFEPGDDVPRVTELCFTETGGLSAWPAGFFDQYQLDVAALGRVRRQR